jgi:glutathione peroxidase-family protein
MNDLQAFLYPLARYHGEVKPQNLVFNANLQEFSQRVSLIANLQTNGKLSPEESYTQVEALWQQLQTSKNQLGIGQSFGEQPGGGASSSCS